MVETEVRNIEEKLGGELRKNFEDPSTLKGTNFVQQIYYESWGFQTERVVAQCIVTLCHFPLGYK